ncbi:MAG: hypothetical protein ABFD79_18245 [Phycisphaerales bacterium]
MNKLKKGMVLVGALVITYVVFKILQPSRFGSLSSMFILLQQCMISVIMAYGTYFLLEMGAFDMTLGANAILSAIVGCRLSVIFGLPGLLIGALITGACLGLVNGIMTSKIKAPSMIISVGLVIIYESLGLVVMGGGSTLRIDSQFRGLGMAPWSIVISLMIAAIIFFLDRYTCFGVHVNAIGSSEPIARSMGININKTKITAFLISGVCAALMGVVNLCYNTTISAATNLSSTTTVFQPLMACMIGLAFKKHMNPIVAILLGSFFLALLQNGLLTNGLESSMQNIFVGVALLVVIKVTSNPRRYDVIK